jgi:glyoxylase-like metal-dependent hydrolase (beta-lactamase superfamily II)
MDKCVQVDLSIAELPGFERFIGAWVGSFAGQNLVVDPGPTVTIPKLLQALETLGVNHIDYVLLTHIHVDHAGGAGALIKFHPEAKVVCHPKAIHHLVEPSRLIKGSRHTLGALMDSYGEIEPLPFGSILEVAKSGFDWFPTPGHSGHHISYLIGGLLFAGESLGVTYPTQSSQYLRPATPRRFFVQSYRESIELLKTVSADSVMFAHFGSLPYSVDLCDRALTQLDLWESIIAAGFEMNDDEIFLRLLNEDPNLSEFENLPQGAQAREVIFIKNSIQGIRYKE